MPRYRTLGALVRGLVAHLEHCNPSPPYAVPADDLSGPLVGYVCQGDCPETHFLAPHVAGDLPPELHAAFRTAEGRRELPGLTLSTRPGPPRPGDELLTPQEVLLIPAFRRADSTRTTHVLAHVMTCVEEAKLKVQETIAAKKAESLTRFDREPLV